MQATPLRSTKTVVRLLILSLLALAYRLWWLGFANGTYRATHYDDEHYLALAHSLVQGNGFAINGVPTSIRPPGYPAFLALIEWITGSADSPARLVQAIIAALCVPFVYVIARRLGGDICAWLAASMYAFYPIAAGWVGFLMTENLLTPLLVLLAWQVSWRPPFPRWWPYSTGGTMAFCVLTRPQALLIVAALLGWLWWAYKPRLHQLAIVWVTFALTMAPWVVRNYLDFQAFIPLTAGKYASTGGYVFWTSNNSITADASTPSWGRWVRHERLPEGIAYDQLIDGPSVDKRGYELGFAFLTEHPDSIPTLLAGKSTRFWSYVEVIGTSPALFALCLVLAPFGALGLIGSCRRARIGGFIPLVVLAQYISCLVFWGDARFRYPIEANLVIAVAYGLSIAASLIHTYMGHIHSRSTRARHNAWIRSLTSNPSLTGRDTNLRPLVSSLAASLPSAEAEDECEPEMDRRAT